MFCRGVKTVKPNFIFNRVNVTGDDSYGRIEGLTRILSMTAESVSLKSINFNKRAMSDQTKTMMITSPKHLSLYECDLSSIPQFKTDYMCRPEFLHFGSEVGSKNAKPDMLGRFIDFSKIKVLQLASDAQVDVLRQYGEQMTSLEVITASICIKDDSKDELTHTVTSIPMHHILSEVNLNVQSIDFNTDPRILLTEMLLQIDPSKSDLTTFKVHGDVAVLMDVEIQQDQTVKPVDSGD